MEHFSHYFILWSKFIFFSCLLEISIWVNNRFNMSKSKSFCFLHQTSTLPRSSQLCQRYKHLSNGLGQSPPMHHLVFSYLTSVSNLLASPDISTSKVCTKLVISRPTESKVTWTLFCSPKVSQPSFAPQKPVQSHLKWWASPVNLLLQVVITSYKIWTPWNALAHSLNLFLLMTFTLCFVLYVWGTRIFSLLQTD